MSEIKSLYGNPIVDAGARESLDMLIDETPVYGNLVDTSNISYSASHISNEVPGIFVGDGEYYPNPTPQQMWISFYDAEGNKLSITNDSTSQSENNIGGSWHYYVVNGNKVTVRSAGTEVRWNSGNFTDTVYTIGGVIASLRAKFKNQSDSSEVGLTYGEYKTEYVPYSTTPDVIKSLSSAVKSEISNIVDEKIDQEKDDIKDYVIESLGEEEDYSIPARKLGVLERTYNLLDESKINWTAVNGYYNCESGYKIPVISGKMMNTNLPRYITFYDDSGVSKGTANSIKPYDHFEVPSGATSMVIKWNSDRVAQYSQIVVYYEDDARLVNADTDRRPYVPYSKFVPMYAGNDIFDYAEPSDLTKGIIKMARVAAIRAANERQHAYRFGTFNVYVSRVGQHFPQIAEMLTDYGIDFCGFQEYKYSAKDVASCIPNWLMPYNTGDRNTELPDYYNNLNNNNDSYDGVGAVSRFEIISAELVALSSEARFVKVIKLKMPKAGSYPGNPTLTVFNYHGSLNRSTRASETQVMLNLVAADDSDFKIIMGDTNCGYNSDNIDHDVWDAYENAGFTPVNRVKPTFSPVHDALGAIDCIFFGPNISLVSCDVVDTAQYPVPYFNGAPLSDHYFLYADLAFDFDAVYGAPWDSESEPT